MTGSLLKGGVWAVVFWAIGPLCAETRITLPAAGGAVAFNYTPAADAGTRPQVLASFGVPGEGVVLFWQTDAQGLHRLGFSFVGSSSGLFYSAPFTRAQAPYRLQIAVGPLASDGPRETGLSLFVDGRLRHFVNHPLSSAANLAVIGANGVGGHWATHSNRGRIEDVREENLVDLDRSQRGRVVADLDAEGAFTAAPGLRLRVTVPSDGPDRQVLFTGGLGKGSYTVALQRQPSGQFALVWSPRGVAGSEKALIQMAPGSTHDFVMRLPGMPGEYEPRWQTVTATFLSAYFFLIHDGRLIEWQALAGEIPKDNRIWVGEKPEQGGPAQFKFAGELFHLEPLSQKDLFGHLRLALQRGPNVPESLEGFPGGYRLKIKFNPAEPGVGSPLVCLGDTGRADMVFWRWVGPNQAVVGLDQWGLHPFLSAPFEVDADTQEIEVRMGTLFPPSVGEWQDRLEVRVGGRVVYELKHVFYRVEPNAIHVAANLPGSSAALENLQGILLKAEPLGAP